MGGEGLPSLASASLEPPTTTWVEFERRRSMGRGDWRGDSVGDMLRGEEGEGVDAAVVTGGGGDTRRRDTAGDAGGEG